MGAKNCPETPRQKMIGMMYLVLTAMLALNVSADILNAFTRVQEGLSATIENFQKKNAEVYKEIDMAYRLNPTKVARTREKTLKIKEEANKLVDFIEQLKVRVVKVADGPEGDVMDIKAKDNLDIGGQVLITEKAGAELKNGLDAFRELLLGYIAADDSVFSESIATSLRTEVPASAGIQSWESYRFEGIPLAGVVTMLTLYQSVVLTAEREMINYLFTFMDSESFKFNKLEALVIPQSRYVLTGEEFKAKVMLAAVDTTQKPEIIVNGRKIGYEGDFGIYKEAATKVGVHKLKGVINYVTSSGVALPKTFQMDYEVANPAVVISPIKMNVFYLGVDNPVSLAAPGLPPDLIEPEISNGELIKKDGGYIVRPKVAGKKCEISVYAKINGQRRKLQTQEFRVKEVPDPVVKVGGEKGGTIKKNLLVAAGGVDVVLENFDFDMKFKVESFNLYTVVDGYTQDIRTNGSSFTPDQLKLIKSLKRHQILIIDQVMVKGPDGTTRKLTPISFKID
ncbi:gliding motility protein GldM [Odoribacter lunatus]|uniref:type IX secretion system motor protein PorM/GldM n=1 Tax=Odoribacter lunatus TaxID=2941335 RepID=UPI00203E7780|nr:gliding motility protein GldM [Odoribacter lunatus]